jgi:hypothetical protein
LVCRKTLPQVVRLVVLRSAADAIVRGIPRPRDGSGGRPVRKGDGSNADDDDEKSEAHFSLLDTLFVGLLLLILRTLFVLKREALHFCKSCENRIPTCFHE